MQQVPPPAVRTRASSSRCESRFVSELMKSYWFTSGRRDLARMEAIPPACETTRDAFTL